MLRRLGLKSAGTFDDVFPQKSFSFQPVIYDIARQEPFLLGKLLSLAVMIHASNQFITGLQDGSNMPDNKNQTCSQSSTTKTVILRKSEENEIFCGCEPTNNQTIVRCFNIYFAFFKR